MKKIVINRCFGGFNLSPLGLQEWAKRKGKTLYFFIPNDIPRDDIDLVSVVKSLKKKSWGKCAELKIVSIPDGVDWEINEYDGLERIDEKHRSWS